MSILETLLSLTRVFCRRFCPEVCAWATCSLAIISCRSDYRLVPGRGVLDVAGVFLCFVLC